MNSEELELSLRTEFESYLKGFLAELRQEVSEFQKNFETEFEKHKAQTDEAVRKLMQRFETGVTFDQAFNESVLEHLRLARDEGATITAVAIGEAEKLKEQTDPSAEFDKLRDAINEISSKTSQSEILKSLVVNAADFAPRGTFFIVRNDHFVGWRAFGDEAGIDEAGVRAIQFPMSADTILAEAISTLTTAAAKGGTHSEDERFLSSLGFGTPDRMYAIPLVARGRGVAVLYADYGAEGASLNQNALEALVRVAGLTVELAAASAQAGSPGAYAPQPETPASVSEYQPQEPADEAGAGDETAPAEIDSAAEEYQGVQELEHADVSAPFYQDSVEVVQEPVEAERVETPVAEYGSERRADFEDQVEAEEYSFEPAAEPVIDQEPVTEQLEEPETVEHLDASVVEEVEEVTYFEPVQEEASQPEPSDPEQPEPVEEYVFVEPAEEFPEVIEEPVPESLQYTHAEPPVDALQGSAAMAESGPVAEVAAAQAGRTRYRDRNVDLPIEVPEDERRLHNDARRFARLLVSEIKLYNEQKVADGRQSGDLYDRLREAIDRSREMYDKRVQQQVADKFDYFHYELVTSLADGNDVKLGASYPGSKVPA